MVLLITFICDDNAGHFFDQKYTVHVFPNALSFAICKLSMKKAKEITADDTAFAILSMIPLSHYTERTNSALVLYYYQDKIMNFIKINN